MLLNTRRRALGLLLAAGVGLRLVPSVPRAFAAKADCYDAKDFGPWKAQATDAQSCDLRVDLQVAASFDAKVIVYGDPDKTKLPKKFLIAPENRLIARTA